MKKVCLLNGDMSRAGGTEKCTAFLSGALAEKGYEVYVGDISNKTGECFFPLKEGITLYNFKEKSIPKKICEIRKFIKENGIDVIINVEAMLGIYTIPATMCKKTKNIIWEHGNFYQKQCKSIDKVRSLEMKLCDSYITLTERDMNTFRREFKGKCRVDFIYNPVERPKNKPNYTGDTKRILSVGLVREIKGYDYLVDVAEKVLAKHPDWKWDVFGNTKHYPEYSAHIEKRIKDSGLEGKVNLCGTTNDIEKEYQSSDIMIMTSLMEGLPMTLLEAKGNKLPIVAFDIETGPSEIIDDNVNGYLIEKYDTEKMAEKINKLIENDDLRKQFSENTKENMEKFSKEDIVKKWIKIIEE